MSVDHATNLLPPNVHLVLEEIDRQPDLGRWLRLAVPEVVLSYPRCSVTVQHQASFQQSLQVFLVLHFVYHLVLNSNIPVHLQPWNRVQESFQPHQLLLSLPRHLFSNLYLPLILQRGLGSRAVVILNARSLQGHRSFHLLPNRLVLTILLVPHQRFNQRPQRDELSFSLGRQLIPDPQHLQLGFALLQVYKEHPSLCCRHFHRVLHAFQVLPS
mmetsp:Transcript_375/g.824  ORF Transcript_375/g.824 Transcript_375/m.824 type:complete len:214 (+) Transcript_375:1700-2341(+)